MKLKIITVIANSILVATFSLADSINQPNFKPFDKSRLDESSFFEQFNYNSLEESNWKISHAKKDDEFSYVGKWDLETASVYPGFANDKGLVMKSPAAHHAISYVLPQAFDNTDNDLVLQYEIKLQNGIICGGTYIKLLNYEFEKLHEFNNDTPYQIMFGPDKCGSNNKVHFIIRRMNPFTKKYDEKHLRASPMSRTGKLTTLYTLILKKNQDFEIRIDGDVAKAGNLISKTNTMDPPLSPPKEISDENDVKPSSWDDKEFIPDPKHPEKPSDYDKKYGLREIPDPDVVKPKGWNDNEPEFIDDPSAAKPDEWDEEEDGEWLAPEIRNPRCVNGCGEWEPPLIENPNYKGPWKVQTIPNPNYMGEWWPRLIPNPEYYEDSTPSNLELIGGLGFELWSMDRQILFDNIYLGHSIREAELIGNQTFVPKLDIEDYNLDHYRQPVKNEPVQPPPTFNDFIENDQSAIDKFIAIFSIILSRQYSDLREYYFNFMGNPIGTISEDPFKFLVYCGAFVTVFTFVFGILGTLVFVATGGSDAVKFEQKQQNIPHIREPVNDSVSPKIEEIIEDDEEVKASSVNISSTSASKRKA